MFTHETYTARRLKLKQKISDGIILLLGNVDTPMNYADNTYAFRQDSSFLYFFGLDFQGLAGVIDTDSGEDIIFGDDVEAGKSFEDFEAMFAASEQGLKTRVSVGDKIRGEILSIEGLNILCIGGADSIDKVYREPKES